LLFVVVGGGGGGGGAYLCNWPYWGFVRVLGMYIKKYIYT